MTFDSKTVKPDPPSDPDFIYDPEDGEVTYPYADRDEITDYDELALGKIKRYETLIKGPPRFAVNMVTSWDDDGDPEETKIIWFTLEEHALAAVEQEKWEAKRSMN